MNSVASRCWAENCEIQLVAATEPMVPSTIGRFIPPVVEAVNAVNSTERDWVEQSAETALVGLERQHLTASLHILSGDPRQVLAEEAENWNADRIFVGANAFGSRLEKFLLGGTSAAVVARAHCWVEVVRVK